MEKENKDQIALQGILHSKYIFLLWGNFQSPFMIGFPEKIPLEIKILYGLYCVIIFTLTENNHFEGGVVNVKKYVILMGESVNKKTP